VDEQQRERAVRQGSGYLAAGLGTLAGGFGGVSIGRFVGMPLAREAAGDVKGSADAEGVDAIVEGFGVGLGAVIVGVMVVFLAIVLSAWLGAVLGCSLAVRLSGNDGAGATALLTGLVGPVVLVGGAPIAQAAFGSISGARGYLFCGAVAVSAALTGRWLTLLLRSPRQGASSGPPQPGDDVLRGG